jgi:hypothetical protein
LTFVPKPRTVEQVYDSCLADGFIVNSAEIDLVKIKGLMENAEKSFDSAKALAKTIGKKSAEWTNVFTLHYETLKAYSEALLIFQKLRISNPICIFSSLCIKYPDLEIDWNFLERVRAKVERIGTEGAQVSYEDWKNVELQFNLYMLTLKKEIDMQRNGL